MLSFPALKFSNTFVWPCLGERKRNRKLIQNSLSQHRYVHFPASFSINRSGKVLHQSKQSHHRISFVMNGSRLAAVAVRSRSSQCFCLERESLCSSCDGLCYYSSCSQPEMGTDWWMEVWSPAPTWDQQIPPALLESHHSRGFSSQR